MFDMAPRVVGGLRCVLGEGPVWDKATQRLVLTDAAQKTVYSLDPVNGLARSYPVAEQLTALVPSDNDRWFGVYGRTIGRFDFRYGSLKPLLVLPGPADVELNDAVCGRDGKLNVGSVDRTGSNRGELYAIAPTLEATVVAGGVGASNGLDTSPDGTVLYHADTFTSVVTAYPSGRTIRVDRPDGLAVDSEGFLWAALWGSGAVRRYSPSGDLVQTVKLPVPLVTNVAFGGPGLSTMFITTARSVGLPSSGAVFAADVGVTGLTAMPFTV